MNMDDQERNREALIDHIAEQDRIIRRRNEQIAAQVEIIEEVRRDLADYQAMHSQQIETIARLQKNPRPLTADDITDEMVLRFMNTYDTQADGSKPAPTLNHFTVARTTITRAALIMALTPPPSRSEGAEELQALIRQAEAEGEGADNEALANYLAAHLTDPTVKEQS